MAARLALPSWLAALAVVALALLAGPVRAAEPDAALRRAESAAHLLDYVAADYPAVVSEGKVRDPAEYREQLEFAERAAALLGELPEVAGKTELEARAQALRAAIEARAAGAEVAARATRLRGDLIAAYRVPVAPRSTPDLSAAASLFEAQCSGCHGREGRGDGPLARTMEPPPANLHDLSRMAARSVHSLYGTLTLGVDGTAMRGFPELSEDARWALAFFAANLGAPPADVREGERLWRAGQGREAFPDLAAVARQAPAEVRSRYGDDAVQVQAYLRAEPRALAARGRSPIQVSRALLRESLQAYRSGDRQAAGERAVASYLEGFEPLEASLDNLDHGLKVAVEREMTALRGAISSAAPEAEVAQRVEAVGRLLDQAEARLEAEPMAPSTAFASALIILLREGLEAILVLAAILAFVAKTGRRDALPYVHAGWVGALALGLATWGAATYLIEVSGAKRELTEGVTALIAAGMLIYVGYWLHSKAHAQVWQRFIRAQVGAALSRGTLAAMAGVSFLAVYREVFEVVLFYQALWVQAGEAGRHAVLAGIGAAALLLAAVAWAIFRYSVRLPIGSFFTATSVLIALMAVVFAGQGVAALQEAGVVGASPVGSVSLPLLGVHPTAQGLAAQALALALVALTFWLARTFHRIGP